MPYSTKLPKGTTIITDKNWMDFSRPCNGPGGTSETGYTPRDMVAHPVGSLGGSKMPAHLVHDMKTIKEMIQERDAKKRTLEARLRKAPAIWLNQSPSYYCWCYAVVHGCMARLIAQNEKFRRLVPESVAGPIKNYRKEGGWGSIAADYIRKNGVADDKAWPWENHTQANKKSYFAPSRENASLTKIAEWWDLETLEEKLSCLLMDIPVACGYSNMGHEMCAIDAVIVNGQIGSLDLDSYAKSGKFNTQARVGARNCLGDDMVAIRSITPSTLGV